METFTMSRKEVLRAGLVRAALAGRSPTPRSRSLVSDGPAVQTPQGARSHGGCGRVAASCAGPPGPASPRRRPPGTGRDAHDAVYDGFNDVHLTEKLRDATRCRSVAPPCAAAPGPGAPRAPPAPGPQTPQPADRAPALGQLAQLDGSPFAWFEERGPVSTLHG